MVWSPTHRPAVPARAERVLKCKHIKHDVSMWKKWTETNDALLNQFLACRMQSSWWKQCQEGSHSFLCNIPLWLYKFGMQKKIKQFSPPLPQRDLGVQTCSDTLDCGQPILPHSAGAPGAPGLASDNKFQQPEPANHWATGAPMKKNRVEMPRFYCWWKVGWYPKWINASSIFWLL